MLLTWMPLFFGIAIENLVDGNLFCNYSQIEHVRKLLTGSNESETYDHLIVKQVGISQRWQA